MNSTIKPKLKPCKTCGDPSYIWSHGNCKHCSQLIKLRDKPKEPVTLKQTTTGKAAKAFRIAPISKSRAEALKKYRRLRDKYFEANPVCEFPGCTSRKITLHHKRGRIGAFLTDKRHFCSLCFGHHRWVEENPLEAQKMGLSEKRIS